MTLADAANGGVAGHLTQGLDVVGQQQGLGAHACSRQSGFSAGMATTNDYDIETGRIIHNITSANGDSEKFSVSGNCLKIRAGSITPHPVNCSQNVQILTRQAGLSKDLEHYLPDT